MAHDAKAYQRPSGRWAWKCSCGVDELVEIVPGKIERVSAARAAAGHRGGMVGKVKRESANVAV